MGICISSESFEIHAIDYGQENVVYYEENNIIGNQQVTGSVYSHQGSKGVNQDSAILYQGFGVEDGALSAVFDGHGENGHIVSKLVMNKLPSLLLKHVLSLPKITSSKQNVKLVDAEPEKIKNFNKWEEAYQSSFKVMDKEIKHLEKLDCSFSGTTVVVAIKQDNDLIIANLGDSRAVLGRKTEEGMEAVQLTNDLKPSVPSEAERIMKCGGRVLALQAEPHIQRVWLPHRDAPGLAMSRAFGDFLLKNYGIICRPDVSYHHLSPNDQFLVLASDGVWDVLSNDQVVSIVCATDNAAAAAQAVVEASIDAWKQKFPNAKRDDCTAVCLNFQQNTSLLNST